MLSVILAGGAILLVSLVGLILYLLVIITVFTRKRFLRSSFFRLAGVLGVADCVCLILMIGYAAPCMMLQKDLSDSLIFGAVLNIGWFSGLPLILLLAVDRYLCICKSEIFPKYYSVKKTNIYCIACWVFGISYSLPSFFSCCGIRFNYEIKSWQWDTRMLGSKVLGYGEISMVVFITVSTFFFNGIVLKYLSKAQRITSLSGVHLQRKNARERKIFLQFLITTLWLLIFDIPFITIGYLDNPSELFGYFVTLAYVLNCSINGLVYITMNKMVRNEACRMLAMDGWCSRRESHSNAKKNSRKRERRQDGIESEIASVSTL